MKLKDHALQNSGVDPGANSITLANVPNLEKVYDTVFKII